FVYGFLAIITAVTVLNIMNSISMSVSARIQQYGAMRAVGMDTQQMTKMIAAEAATYALSGCMVGCVVGLLLSKLLYDTLITTHFAYAIWSFPVIPLAIILLFVLAAAVAAVYAPAKRIRNMAVTDTINEL
ncbi:MAG: ABC transporter permease, partial [Oscillospiraceae bacterium]